MRFVESVLVGVPLFWFMFFVALLATDTSAYFMPESAELPLIPFYNNSGGVTDIKDLNTLGLTSEFGTQPLPNVNESGVISFFSVPRQGWGFISTIVKLEWTMLTLPMQDVAGKNGTNDVVIFNNLFWGLFVAPSHMLLIFAFLFFIRSG
jgi:hypothetical protein